jgi:glycosyltransferase involved in cell wall biosynthesis
MSSVKPIHHVVLLAGRLDRGAGSHVYNRELAVRLRRRGYQVTVICFAGPRQILGDIQVLAVKHEGPWKWPSAWRFSDLERFWRCTKAIRTSSLIRPDTVIGAEHLFLPAFRRRYPRVPLIYLPHALLIRPEIQSYKLDFLRERMALGLYEGLQRWALRHAEYTVRFTSHACDVLQQHYRMIRTKFVVNPMGVDLPPEAARPSMPDLRLLWVGQLIHRKRIDLALKALARLRDQPWRFDVVGDGECRAALETLAAELGLDERVSFHGFQAEPRRFYADADLFVFPWWLENSPVSMLEAMSHGVPSIAMRHDGSRYHNANGEIVNDGVDGFLASSDEHFVSLLSELVGAPAKVRAAGREARRSIESRHTWNQHLDRFEQLFGEVAEWHHDRWMRRSADSVR